MEVYVVFTAVVEGCDYYKNQNCAAQKAHREWLNSALKFSQNSHFSFSNFRILDIF
jgi:hypothetical protein